MNSVRLKLAPPWITHMNMIQALFDGDPQIACNINWSSADPSIVLATNNADKATALARILPEQVTFGNIILKISIDGPFSNRAFTTPKELYETAFDKNPAFAYCVAPAQEGFHWVDFTYVVFKNCVVQFFNDNLNDPHGVISTLYQDIAAEVLTNDFTGANVCYCTDVERKLGMPLGEWP